MMSGRHLVIGLGEIGRAISELLTEAYGVPLVDGIDKDTAGRGKYAVLHICFPYGPDFQRYVGEYQEKYLGEDAITIVHATVPIGTCYEVRAVSSPVRGTHPNIISGLRSMVKYFGGQDAYVAAKYFEGAGVKTRVLPHSKDCEAAKLWDTLQFGWMILLNKAIKESCDREGVNFEIVYREWNQTYNEGYKALGQEKFCRPYLDFVPGGVGGHCVMPNLHLLKSSLCDILLEADRVIREEGTLEAL